MISPSRLTPRGKHLSGARLGSYEVSSQIGVGGMGEVYRATDTSLGRQVAVKVLPAASSQDAERVARFERYTARRGVADRAADRRGARSRT